MKRFIRSDLACEAGCDLSNIEGTEYSKVGRGVCTVEALSVNTEEAAVKLGHAMGNYVTVTSERLWLLSDETVELISDIISDQIKKMICKLCGIDKIAPDTSILVVGLGNRSITADALGPQAVDLLMVTRHLNELDRTLFEDLGMCRLSALTPGVLGKTGIESSELIRATVESVSPDAIIVIDALAAGTVERLATTVQLSDTGIDPGAGIGNLRTRISEEALGIPVLAIGIPTVVDSSTLVSDALLRANVSELDEETLARLENNRSFYVTPKETDLITERSAKLLSDAINKAMVI